jgi:serine protease Do
LMAEALGVTGEAGAILSDVAPGSPAARAGLQSGDLILSLDGKRIENGRQFRINLYTRGVGDTVASEARRGTSKFTARVAVGERDNDAGRLSDMVALLSPVRALGITALDLSPRIAKLLPSVRRERGAVVAAVSAAAPFSHQGRLQPGDVIYSLNGKTVGSVAELNTAADATKAGTPSVLQLEREGVLLYLAFRRQ